MKKLNHSSTEQIEKNKNITRLTKREENIEGHLSLIDSNAFDIGRELAAIHAEGDYPDKSFQAYVKRRWDRERNWAYKLMEGFQIKNQLPMNVSSEIQTPKHALALRDAPAEARAEIILQVSTTGKISARRISEAVKKELKKKNTNLKDLPLLPDAIKLDWLRATEISKQIKNGLKASLKILEAGIGSDMLFIEMNESATQMLLSLTKEIDLITPAALCPSCKGIRRKECNFCNTRGFVSRTLLKHYKKDKHLNLNKKTSRRVS